MNKLNQALVAIIRLSATAVLSAVPASAQTAPNLASAASVEQVLLADNGLWWGGGMDTFSQVCTSADRCKAGVAFHFKKERGQLRVRIAFTSGKIAYEAYLKGKRFAGDTRPEAIGRASVSVTSNGFSFENRFRWSCEFVNLASSRDAKCVRDLKNGITNPFRIQILPAEVSSR